MKPTEQTIEDPLSVSGAVAMLRAYRRSRKTLRLGVVARTVSARSSGRRSSLGLRGALACGIALLALALPAAPAVAKQVRLFTGSFGSASSTVPDPYPLAERLTSVAVDTSTHDVYVTDAGNHRVEKFDSSGNFLLAFGADVGGPGVNVCGGVVICQSGTPGTAPQQLTNPLTIAVDNSSGPSQGDVYVGDFSEGRIVSGNKVLKFDSSGNLVTSWGAGGELDGSSVTTPPAPLPGPFNALEGVAVDPSGNLWVEGQEPAGIVNSGKARVFEFKQDATFVTDWAPQSEGIPLGPFGIAVDAEDNIYFLEGDAIMKLSAIGAEIGPIDLAQNNAVAVDPSTGDLYRSAQNKIGGIERFDASCKPQVVVCVPAETFAAGSEGFSGLAVDSAVPAKTVYAAKFAGQVTAFSLETVPDVETLAPTNASVSTATLNGTVNPAGQPVTECFFEWGETTGYANKAPCEQPDAEELGSATAPVDVHAAITGLQSGKTYHFRLAAANANDVNSLVDQPNQGPDRTFGPPLLESESVSAVASTSADLQAQVNPNSLDTRVRIEYGTEAGNYTQATPETDIGSGETGQTVSPQIHGLSPATHYHYRARAASPLGTVEGEDRTFTTQGPGGPLVLPDGREWELVSPADKLGAALVFPGVNQFPTIAASASGDAITYMTSAPIEPQPAGNANDSSVFATRTVSGWLSRDIAAPNSGATGANGAFREYPFFSDDLSLAVLQPFAGFIPCAGASATKQKCLSEAASEQTAFLRDTATGTYTPLVTGCPASDEPCASAVEEHADVPPGTVFGGCDSGLGCSNVRPEVPGRPCPPELFCGPSFQAATGDLAHIVLDSFVPLTAEGIFHADNLYEWTAGHLQFIGEGELADAAAGNNHAFARHAISADGSRVIYYNENPSGVGGVNALDMHDLATGETIQLDALVSGPGEPVEVSRQHEFQAASADGSRVFFTSLRPLIAGAGPLDLYECEIVEVAGKLKCELSDRGSVVRDLPAFDSRAIGASEDGAYIYFVAEHQELEVLHNGATKRVASLSPEDRADWGGKAINAPGETARAIAEMPARVSPDGRYLAFTSLESLTGYDNHDAVSGKPDEEVYLYDAGANAGEGVLRCVSCNPTGARPHGVEFGHTEHGPAHGNGTTWETNTWVAASVPSSATASHETRVLSDSGRLFFNAADALVPQDTNNTEDVYGYEPPGVGDCTEASSTFSPTAEGCIALISSGTSSQESGFLDASENGDDVFFATAARLTPQDTDTAYDVYDAHVCTAAAPCLPTPPPAPPACLGDACQASVEAPNDPTPSSLSFQGPGNLDSPILPPPPKHKSAAQLRAEKLAKALKQCRKHKQRRKRVRCERSARKQFAAKRAKRASNDRSTKR